MSIIRSFELAAERCADITPPVYAKLFARHPRMEMLFVRDTTGNVRGEMLVRAVEVIFDFLGPNAYAENFLKCEAVTHDGYGVPPEIFSDFFDCLRDTLRDVNASDWTPAMEKSWCELLETLSAFSAVRAETL